MSAHTLARAGAHRLARALGYEQADVRTALHLAARIVRALLQVRADNLARRRLDTAARPGVTRWVG